MQLLSASFEGTVSGKESEDSGSLERADSRTSDGSSRVVTTQTNVQLSAMAWHGMAWHGADLSTEELVSRVIC